MPDPRDARTIAFEILQRVERRGAFASLLLQRLGPGVPEREIALATEIIYGCLRSRFRDEHVLEHLAGRPLKEIDPDIALLFRIAAHQILRLDRIPDSAAVNEAVKAARSSGAAKFLNAVLRRLCRERWRLPVPRIPGPPADPHEIAEAMAVCESHPAWMIARWIGRLGVQETRLLLRANNTPAPLSVRVDLARAPREEAAASMASEGVRTSPSALLDDFLRVKGGAPQRTSAFRDGWIYIQDEASGLIPRLLAAAAGARILDACAAPGGKTLALARMTGETGRVVAADLHPSRLGLVAANVRRLGVTNVRLVAADMAQPPFSALFDAVLVDAPCSGSGVFRRDVESRYRLTPDQLAAIARTQAAILRGAASLVKPGGRLLYSVCSLEPEEGRDQVAALLAERSDLRRADLRPLLPGRPDLFDAEGDLATFPHRHDLDGFYAAALTRLPLQA